MSPASGMFVDYAGTTLEVIDGATGEVRDCQLFVAALGASSYTYAEATWTQGLADWIGSHTRAFAFFGGVTAHDGVRQPEVGHHQGVLLRAGGQPHLRRDGGSLRHGHRAGAAAGSRATRPRSRWRCSWRRAGSSPSCAIGSFFSLVELNAAIRELVTQLNDRVTRHLGASRRALFDEIERPALKPLPAEPYLYAEWKECRVGLDYHVEVEQALLLRAAHAAAREGVGADHGAHHRGLPSRQARRGAYAIVIGPPAHDGARAHAVEPSALCRLDAGADQAAGRRDRAQYLGAGRDHHARALPPRARLPRLRSASSGWPRATAATGWRQPAAGRWRSARAPSPPSIRS